MRLKAARSCLVVTSFVKEGHADTPCPDWLLANIALLTTAAQRLDVPLFMAHGDADPIEDLFFGSARRRRTRAPCRDSRRVTATSRGFPT